MARIRAQQALAGRLGGRIGVRASRFGRVRRIRTPPGLRSAYQPVVDGVLLRLGRCHGRVRLHVVVLR